jgi:uncharacterized protein YbjT (DUF2867 family)
MRILITGITGAIGSELAPRLVAAGHDVRGLTRDIQAAASGGRVPDGVQLVPGDAVAGTGLEPACEDVDVAYYLIHSMEPSGDVRFDALEEQAASNFAQAAQRAGIRRLIFLGGMAPPAEHVSLHMASRLRVERIVLQSAPESLALRASIVIGSRSRSFRLLVRLIERLPALILPDWERHLTTPVDQRDVTESLIRAATATPVGSSTEPHGIDQRETLDLAGPEVVSYGELMVRIRDAMILDRPVIRLPGITMNPVASRLSALIAEEEHSLVGPLMGSLATDLLPSMPNAMERLGVRKHSLDSAIERALREWESAEALRAR